ncbi:DUF6446 family protein [Hasllibacter sp. MH4015]|uniref:DUF6446 family protein n=1 Tax=Hasllibacter sp. MH4015 TaxID=2854029 RepID=UPI001CD29411|nr:DUF6446 family protein [Hasllibacter sp. MH4015]
MTSGRATVLVILVVTILFGIGMWYANTRAYYVPLDEVTIELQRPDGTLTALEIAGAEGIDADSSPLRFRACFRVEPERVAALIAEAMPYEDATPLTTPAWFDCFDATFIGAAIEAGDATALLGQRNIERGVDRVVAIFPDGRGFAWHQLNETLE